MLAVSAFVYWSGLLRGAMIEQAIKKKLTDLVRRAQYAKINSSDNEDADSWEGWLTEALHIVELVFPNPNAIYRARVQEIAEEEWSLEARVRDIGSILRGLSSDIELGLITNLTNKIRAEAFDDFLDHAESYRSAGRKNEAGAIAGVVFEDTVRRVFRDKIGQDDAGKSLERINQRVSSGAVDNQPTEQTSKGSVARANKGHSRPMGRVRHGRS